MVDAKMLTPRQMRAIIAKIESHKKAIARHRDALRDIYSDLEMIADSADEGVRLLEAAVDELSGYL